MESKNGCEIGLKIKILKWSGGFPIVMLHKKTAQKIGAHVNDRVKINILSNPRKEIIVVLDITEQFLKENQLGVSSEVQERLEFKKNQRVQVCLASAPESMVIIRKKLKKQELNELEINKIIEEIVDNSLSEPEIALFVSAMYKHEMNMKETIYLIKAILKTGKKLELNKKNIVDKHSIGGIAGRVTPILVSICASAGLIIPKTSSRAITSPAGTADAIETLAKVDFSIEEIKKIVKKTNACIVWGGGLGMVPADSKIIHVEKILKIDPGSQLLASIMAKKLAVGGKHILIQIPYGKSAKVNKAKALNLKKKFEYLGKYFKKNLKVVLTKNFGPLGNGIGPVLEMEDVLKVLDPKQQGPSHLEEVSIRLSGELLEMTGKAKKGKGIKMAKEILVSGKAFEKFKQIIIAQQGKINSFPRARFKKEIKSKKTGKIKEIDNKKINTLAIITGCPIDKSAGVYLYFQYGEKVKKREKLLTIYSESKSRLKEAVSFYKKNKIIEIK